MRRIDNRRTDDLQRAGFHVFRFTEKEVLTNILGVAKEIGRMVEDIEPPPAPPPAGDSDPVMSEEYQMFVSVMNRPQPGIDVSRLDGRC